MQKSQIQAEKVAGFYGDVNCMAVEHIPISRWSVIKTNIHKSDRDTALSMADSAPVI